MAKKKKKVKIVVKKSYTDISLDYMIDTKKILIDILKELKRGV